MGARRRSSDPGGTAGVDRPSPKRRGPADDARRTDPGDDPGWMAEALAAAAVAGRAGEVPIGAVVVADGRLIGRGGNAPIAARDPTAHAEVLALRAAAATLGNYRLPGTTLYVTVEPCLMCMGAALQARVARVVFGCDDPKAGAARSLYAVGDDRRLNHRIAITAGVRAEEARALLQTFFRTRRG